MNKLILSLLILVTPVYGQVINKRPTKQATQDTAEAWARHGRCPFQLENKARFICLRILKEEREKGLQ